MHQAWIENSCEHGLADLVLVAERGGKVLGFHTLKIDVLNGLPIGKTALIAVDDAAAGKGVGRKLIEEGFRRLKDKVRRFRVRTEAANIPAIQLYQKCGFTLDHSSLYCSRVIDPI